MTQMDSIEMPYIVTIELYNKWKGNVVPFKPIRFGSSLSRKMAAMARKYKIKGSLINNYMSCLKSSVTPAWITVINRIRQYNFTIFQGKKESGQKKKKSPESMRCECDEKANCSLIGWGRVSCGRSYVISCHVMGHRSTEASNHRFACKLFTPNEQSDYFSANSSIDSLVSRCHFSCA